jgi:hypothetical protein
MGIHVQTHRLMGRFMQCAVEMDTGVMICIPSFIKIGSGIKTLIGGYTYRHTDWWEGFMQCAV